MSDNIIILDANSVMRYLKTTEVDPDTFLHVPHHILEDAPKDYWLDIAAGLVPGALPLNKFGRNTDVDTAAAEDVWSAGGTWAPPTAARLHDIVSTSTDDDSAGTGARTVQVYGLDASYEEVNEIVTLDGTTDVATTLSYVVITRMIVRTAGSGGMNAGVISATAQTDSTVTAEIPAGKNQTLMAIWQVPAGVSLYVLDYYASANGLTANHADVELWAKPFGEVWQLKHILGVDTEGVGYFHHEFKPPLVFAEKTLLKVRATAGANNLDVSAGFDGVYL